MKIFIYNYSIMNKKLSNELNKKFNEGLNLEDLTSIWNDLDESDLSIFVDFIINHPSTEWLGFIHLAEENKIPKSEYLNSRSDEIYESIAPMIADEDGLVNVDE